MAKKLQGHGAPGDHALFRGCMLDTGVRQSVHKVGESKRRLREAPDTARAKAGRQGTLV
jgi:hypothetical protein